MTAPGRPARRDPGASFKADRRQVGALAPVLGQAEIKRWAREIEAGEMDRCAGYGLAAGSARKRPKAATSASAHARSAAAAAPERSARPAAQRRPAQLRLRPRRAAGRADRRRNADLHPPRPARLHAPADRLLGQSHRLLHLRPLRHARIEHRLGDDPARLRRPVHRPRDRPAVPAGALL